MLLNNLEDEHSLLMTFAQIMSNSEKKNISSKNSTKAAAWKLVPGPFVFSENQA